MTNERWLNFLKHVTQFILHFSRHGRSAECIHSMQDMWDMFIKLIQVQLLQDFAQLLGLKSPRIQDAFFLDFSQNILIHIRRNLSTLLCLKLRQPFIKVINLLVSKVRDFTGRILVRRLLRIHKDKVLITAFRTT